MPVYRINHNCGFQGDQFLNQDKESVVMPCPRCGRNTSARQVRDKAAVITGKDEVKGVFRNDTGSGHANTQ